MDESNLLLGNLKVLILANNNISDACGLDRLYSLEILDMKYNRITNLCDVSALAKLPNLTKFDVEGNPLITKGKKHTYYTC
jgi:Leucine-rich repeat (LRR) protein